MDKEVKGLLMIYAVGGVLFIIGLAVTLSFTCNHGC